MLLEALASLLSASPWDSADIDAKRLAARAYLKAAYEVAEPQTREAYRKLARIALSRQLTGGDKHEELKLEEVEREFKQELADAEAWYDGVRRDELAWISAGQDVDAEFAKKYYEEPQLPGLEFDLADYTHWLVYSLAALGCLAVVSLLFVIWRWRKRRMAARYS